MAPLRVGATGVDCGTPAGEWSARSVVRTHCVHHSLATSPRGHPTAFRGGRVARRSSDKLSTAAGWILCLMRNGRVKEFVFFNYNNYLLIP